LPPAVHFIQISGIADGKSLTCSPVAVTASDGTAHVNMIHTFFPITARNSRASVGSASVCGCASARLATRVTFLRHSEHGNYDLSRG
ncbi:MAG TPA: hypothetical protein VJZ25_03055, partial [Gemmatimonadaceae bacterium]|nr:hypothetical protein [Gemmatimonadaceae bacterium]